MSSFAKALSKGQPRRLQPAGLLLSLPVVLVLLIFFVWPTWSLFILSVLEKGPPGEGSQFTFQFYWKFLSNDYYLWVLRRTLGIGVIVSVLAVLLGYPVGYYIATQRSGRMQSILMFCVVGPLMVSIVIRAYGWLVILGPTGVINSFLVGNGLSSGPLRLMYNDFGITLGLLNVLLPFMILSVNSSLARMDPALPLAAADLGANPRRAFFSVIFPITLPGVMAGVILVFTLACSFFAVPAILGGSRVRVMSYIAYEQALELVNWPFGAAVTVILFVVICAVTLILQRIAEARWTRAIR